MIGKIPQGLVIAFTLALGLVFQPVGLAAKEAANVAAAPPAGFTVQTVVSGLNLPTSFAFAPDGRIFIAEKNGVVRVFKNGSLLPTPLIDISAIVNNYGDRGLIGMALDPNFASNGYIYLLYPYEATATDDSGGKTSRLSRFTVVGDTASPSTEKVILGTNVGSACSQFPVGSDCIPAEWYGHGVGDIHFGADGTMFLTNGDASSWNEVTDDALRAQNLDSLAGKILRIDPSTGQGLADNPYWNGNPNAARSKVWAYGVRNAYRFSVRPGSGSPGTVYAGDVGWNNTEEVDAVPKGANLGWPCYEGNAAQSGYQLKPVCLALYSAVAADPSKWTQAILTYEHNGVGAAVTGGPFYTATTYPAQYQGAYFFGDYARNLIQYVTVNGGNAVTSGPFTFDASADSPVDIQLGPDGNIYYLSIVSGQVRMYVYGGGPPPPPPVGGYLSDLPWTQATNGWGPVERDMSNGDLAAGDGHTITLNGVTYAKGLGTHAAADISYALNGCTSFQSDVGLDDEVGTNGSVVFQVYLDGTLAYDSGLMTGASATKSINLTVTGKSILRLVATNGGDNINYDHADWAGARITCGSGGGTPLTVTSVLPAEASTGVVASSNVTASFSADVNQSTLTASTVTLQQGANPPIAAALAYNAATRTVTLDPNADLQAGATYTATVVGGANGVKDTAGNTLAASKVWTFTVASAGGSTTSYLSDLPWTSAANGWGPVERDMSVGGQAAGDGTPINLNGVVYAKGLGTHAASDIRYPLSGCTSFQSDVGLDDEVGANGTVNFQVFLDGTLAYDSGVMTGATATKSINLNLTGKSQLGLVVTNGGDNINYDHADWAGARITCGSGGNRPPVPTITSPTSSTTFAIGDVINFQGSATDPDDGTLPASALSWQINIQHCIGASCHIHFFMTVPGSGGSFIVPDHGDMFHFDLTLTATDSAGLSTSTTVSIQPRTLNLTLATNPTGLQVVEGGTAAAAPYTTTQVDGATVTLTAPSPQNGATFSSWSDGGGQQHNVTLGTADVTYTANFAASQNLTVTSVSPADASTGVVASSNVTASFSADVNQSTLTASTVTLQQGANPPIAAALAYNTVTRTVTLDPNADLQAGATYTATVVGGANGVKDTSGNTLAASKVWTFTVASAGGSTTSYLSDLPWTSATNGWGPVERDMSVGGQAAGDGTTINLNGTTYAKGLGTHAVSDIRYPLSGCTSFQSDVGVDDESLGNGTVNFQVFLDGAQVYDSGVMTGATATKSINLNLTGKSQLGLVVTNGGDNINYDHADWAGARITCGSGGGTPLTVTSVLPADASTGVVASSNVTASFSADVNQSTLTASTVTLQQGANPPVAATLAYNAATRTVTLDPNADLQAGATYTATVVGGANGVKDTNGNTLAASRVWTFTVASAGGSTTSYLSDLTWTQATNGWGPVERDMSVGGQAAGDGRTITLNGVTYAKGLGVNAASDIRFTIGGKCTSFKTDVGVDDEVGTNGSVVFQVYLDGTKVYDSNKMTGSTATKSVTLTVTGKQQLRLVVGVSTNGNASDHADWAGARVTCSS